MPADVVIAACGADEVPAVSALIREVILGCAYYPDHARERMADLYVERELGWRLEQDRDDILVACDGGRPVGFVSTEANDEVLSVYWVGVAPGHRRRGIGTQLFAAAVDRGRRAECVVAEAHILSSNFHSLSAAHRAGFSTAAQFPRYWWRLSWSLLVCEIGPSLGGTLQLEEAA